MAFNNISYYKAYRTKLLNDLYPNESNISIGQVIFKNKPLIGVKVRLWLDGISIILEENYSIKNKRLIDSLPNKTKHLSNFFEVKISPLNIIIKPLNKNEFPDTITGMQNRARYYVLCLDLFLKYLIN